MMLHSYNINQMGVVPLLVVIAPKWIRGASQVVCSANSLAKMKCDNQVRPYQQTDMSRIIDCKAIARYI